ncbi:MAG: hypothetical protein DRJ65_01760 [Acidobacteria bacterium]|nr:MAG: hypothetical protein DRJ65_01760 [Acidobacteriota bacterium]
MIGRLFRSGWWVVLAAVISVVGILALVVRPGPITGIGDGNDPATYGFDLDCMRISGIVAGGMGRDGLHAVDNPETVAGTQVATINEEHRGKLLVGSDRVIGVIIKGEARAYPLRLMRWHEVVNDDLGGESIVVTYSGLSDASAVWRRPVIAGQPLSFAVSGLLSNSNTLIYDRARPEGEPSLWSQLGGHAVAGQLACSEAHLQGLPFDLTLWSDWFEQHPDTDVMAPLPELKRLYKRDPYHSYFGSQVLHFPVDPMPPADGLDPKESVVIVENGSQRKVFAVSSLAADAGVPQGSVDVTIANLPLRIHFTTLPATARVEALDDSDQIPVMRIAFWFAWHAQFPNDPLATP